MPGSDLVVHLAHADAVGPVEQAAAITRKAEPVQPHHVDVAWSIRLAFLEYLARLVHRREQQPAQDLLVGELALRNAEAGGDLLDNSSNLRIWMRRAVALLVAIPSRSGLLTVSPQLRQAIGDRLLAEIRVLRRAALAAGIADVETGQIADGERTHRITEVHHHLVDLLG